MTMQEFFGKLLALQMEWQKYHWGGIRARKLILLNNVLQEKEFCPMTAVAYELTGKYHVPCEWLAAANEIGYSHELASSIVLAADSLYHEGHLFLLQALGLTGEPVQDWRH